MASYPDSFCKAANQVYLGKVFGAVCGGVIHMTVTGEENHDDVQSLWAELQALIKEQFEDMRIAPFIDMTIDHAVSVHARSARIAELRRRLARLSSV